MIFLWLQAALLFLVKLIVPPPPSRTRINPRAACPACGSKSGAIETVEVAKKIVVQHNCKTCKCYWYEEPITAGVAIRAAQIHVLPTA